MFPQFSLGSTAWGIELALDGNAPAAAGSLPTFRVLGPNGSNALLASGTCTAFDSGNLTGAYKFSFTLNGSFNRGNIYLVSVSYTVNGDTRQSLHVFQVV